MFFLFIVLLSVLIRPFRTLCRYHSTGSFERALVVIDEARETCRLDLSKDQRPRLLNSFWTCICPSEMLVIANVIPDGHSRSIIVDESLAMMCDRRLHRSR